MKRINLYIFIVLITGLTACSEDFLDTKSPSKQSPEIIYNSLSLTNSAVLGAYNSLLNSLYTGNTVLYLQSNSDIEVTYRGFGIDSYKDVGVAGYGNYFNIPQNNLNKWEAFYRSIEIASNSIEGIRKSPLMETYPKEMKCYLGEALTIRAMVYFHLVKFYGDVPFRRGLSSADLSNVYTGRTDRDTIYHYIIQDLKEAIEYLPYMGTSAGTINYSTPDRITKAYAKGLLARIALSAGGWSLRDGNEFPKTESQIVKHLTIIEHNGFYTGRVTDTLREEYYKLAAKECAELISDANNPHKLDPSYIDIWQKVCQYQYNSYNENLFQFAYGMAQNGDVLGNLMGYGTAGGDKWGRRMNGGYCMSTGYYFYSFNPQDKRRDVALVTASWQSTNKEAMATNPVGVNIGKWRIYWMTDAYLALNRVGTDGRIPNGIDWIDMRFSDIYLMFAEAQNDLYGPDEMNDVAGITPRQALEKVRERAFGIGNSEITAYNGATKEDFFNAIVNERAWEFGGEGLRKWDLVRWGMLSKKIEDMKLALCRLMADKDVQIFDRFYPEGTLPQTIYYKFKDNEYIDLSSIDYYTRNIPAGTDYLTSGWYSSATYKSYNTNAAGVLLSSTGLNVEQPDYLAFVNDLAVGDIATITTNLSARLSYAKNNTCNNRYITPIYYDDINVSRGNLKNSYGY